jgi:hypothetical protein
MTNEVNEMSAASRGSGANYSAFPNSWIPVTERLPELDERVLLGNAADEWVCFGSRQITGEYHHWDGDDYEELNEPTHWQPSPAPPADGK